MGFPEDLAHLVEQIRARLPNVHGEEGAKTSLIMPFLAVLGFDPSDPLEVVPEYAADLPERRGGPKEKVDYAIQIGGRIAMFVECKAVDEDLANHGGQLARYFAASQETRVGVLTNGVRYRVFTDLQKPNIMDSAPWLDVDLREATAEQVAALQLLCRAEFDEARIAARAEEMAYLNRMIDLLTAQLAQPSETFVRWVAHEIEAASLVTHKLVERLTPLVQQALQATIVQHVSKSLAAPPNEPRHRAPKPPAEPSPAAA